MTRAIIINPFRRSVLEIAIPNTRIETIYEEIGHEGFDIARLGSNVVAFVDDAGLKRKDQRYWFFNKPGGGVLMAGKALLLSMGFDGETLELDRRVDVNVTRGFVQFIGNADAAEVAIIAGAVARPEITVNGNVTWRWSPGEEKL